MWVGMLLYLLIFWLDIPCTTLSLVCKQHKKPCADWQKGVLLGTPKDIHLNGPIFLVWVIGVPMTWIISLGLRWFIDCILNWQENIAFRTKLSIFISFKNLFSDSPFFSICHWWVWYCLLFTTIKTAKWVYYACLYQPLPMGKRKAYAINNLQFFEDSRTLFVFKRKKIAIKN